MTERESLVKIEAHFIYFKIVQEKIILHTIANITYDVKSGKNINLQHTACQYGKTMQLWGKISFCPLLMNDNAINKNTKHC